jgi:hypothetical protein
MHKNYSTNLLLNLVHVKLLATMKADLGAELMELDLVEWFCKNITKLLICSDEYHLNLLILYIFPDNVTSITYSRIR